MAGMRSRQLIPQKLGDLGMFEHTQEIIENRRIFYEIVNLLTLHQSEKFFVHKRINSKILIDFLYTTKVSRKKLMYVSIVCEVEIRDVAT